MYCLWKILVLKMFQEKKKVEMILSWVHIGLLLVKCLLMMLLGHAYYMTYDYEAAVAMYDKVIAADTSKERKEAAAANKKAVLDAMYE